MFAQYYHYMVVSIVSKHISLSKRYKNNEG